MTRFASTQRVFFIEEPLFDDSATAPRLDTRNAGGVIVAVPVLPSGWSSTQITNAQRRFVAELAASGSLPPIFWVYTPMAFPLIDGLTASSVVYDCMDDLTGFLGASPELRTREAALLRVADVVFTGGHSLYAAKRELHPRVFPFPSSVDVPHFKRARRPCAEPADQAPIPRPRVGFCGVIDERLDVALLDSASAHHPDVQFIMIGPTAKIDPSMLPARPNIHYLGMKAYADLPHYFAGWDAGWLPFARNAATRYISPTKTPEYLAAGLPVISTSIADVVRPYGEAGLVRIADTPGEVSSALDAILNELPPMRQARRKAADRMLATMSWDRTWAAMVDAIESNTSIAHGDDTAAVELESPSAQGG